MSWRERIEQEEFSNPAFKGAYRKGFEASMGGKTRRECPYDPDNFNSQGVTFSRAFWRMWNKGYSDAERWRKDHT